MSSELKAALEEETVVGRAAGAAGNVRLLIADRVDEISGVLSEGTADEEDTKMFRIS